MCGTEYFATTTTTADQIPVRYKYDGSQCCAQKRRKNVDDNEKNNYQALKQPAASRLCLCQQKGGLISESK